MYKEKSELKRIGTELNIEPEQVFALHSHCYIILYTLYYKDTDRDTIDRSTTLKIQNTAYNMKYDEMIGRRMLGLVPFLRSTFVQVFPIQSNICTVQYLEHKC
jgi:hypothetical protein